NGDNLAEVTHCDYIKQTFCEDVPDYPQEFVNQMLAKNSSLLRYAYEDVIAVSPRLDNEEEPLCLSTVCFHYISDIGTLLSQSVIRRRALEQWWESFAGLSPKCANHCEH
ncbi:hypothetical protein G5I_01183, partial [Acromyrmex echinatior]